MGESFTENQKRNQKTIHGLEAELKSMSKECAKLKSDMEVAKNETLVETDSQLGVQAQLKSEIKEILVENAELRSNYRIVETWEKEIQVKIESLEIDNNKLVSKADIITKDFEKEAKEQEAIYKEKMSGLEKVFDSLQKRIDELQTRRKVETEHENKKEVMDLEARLEKLEKKKVEVLREKNDLVADLVKCKKEIDKLNSEKAVLVADLESEQKKKLEKTEDSELFIALQVEYAKVQQELKEVKLDLRIQMRELEKKSSLVTCIREKEIKHKEKIDELERDKCTLENEVQESKSSIESGAADKENLKVQGVKLEKQLLEIKKIKEEKSEMLIEIRKFKTDASLIDGRI